MKIAFLMLSLFNATAGQQQDGDAAAALMNHLAGRWTMAGTLGGKQIIHDVEATWVLKHEYIQFHEVSRERGGGPACRSDSLSRLACEDKRVYVSVARQHGRRRPLARRHRARNTIRYCDPAGLHAVDARIAAHHVRLRPGL